MQDVSAGARPCHRRPPGGNVKGGESGGHAMSGSEAVANILIVGDEAAVRKQLDRIRPAKQARRINAGLRAFREAVEQVLPLVQSAAALNDPVPLSSAVRGLFRFLLAATGAADGVLLVRAYDPARDPAE